MALVDCFEALVNKRVYKDAWELEDTLSFIESESSKAFGPKLVSLCLNHSDKFVEILQKYDS